MNIYTEDEALIELLEEGCTNDKRYKRLPKDVIKGYIKEEFYKLKYCSTVVYMVPRA